VRRSDNPDFIYHNDIVIGIDLSSDFCSEHEWGIKRIKQDFGIDSGRLGIEGRLITKPGDVYWYNKKTFTDHKEKIQICGFTTSYKKYDDTIISMKDAMRAAETVAWVGSYGKSIQAAWCESDFAVFSSDPKHWPLLKTIYESFAKLDTCISIGKSIVFSNGGLCLTVASMIPEDIKTKVLNDDLAYACLMNEFRETKIEDILKKANCGYYALSPKRKEDGSLMFWLNPTEQQKNNYGWFTLQDLEDWAKGKGKIPRVSK